MCYIYYPRYAMCGHPYRGPEERDPSRPGMHGQWERRATSLLTRESCGAYNEFCDDSQCKWVSDNIIQFNEGWCPSCDTEYTIDGQTFKRARDLFLDIDVKYNHFCYQGSNLFTAVEMVTLAQRVEDIKKGFEAEANNGPYNKSYMFLDEQLAGFIKDWTACLLWNQERAPERAAAHNKYLRHKAQMAERERAEAAERAEAEARQQALNKRRRYLEEKFLEEQQRALLNQERDANALIRPSSSTSRWNLR